MITSMLSLAMGLAVKRDVAMTGEVTLTGRVLPIGGVFDLSKFFEFFYSLLCCGLSSNLQCHVLRLLYHRKSYCRLVINHEHYIASLEHVTHCNLPCCRI